jgi:uncharacterized protein (DUF1778 family)
MSTSNQSKSERIDVRATPAVKHLLQQASQLNHKSVSEFLLEAGIMAANKSLADRRRFELEDSQWLAFNAALERPVASPASKARLHTLLSTPSILE